MLIQYIPDSVLRDKYWMEQVPLLAERTEQAATGWSKEREEKKESMEEKNQRIMIFNQEKPVAIKSKVSHQLVLPF